MHLIPHITPFRLGNLAVDKLLCYSDTGVLGPMGLFFINVDLSGLDPLKQFDDLLVEESRKAAQLLSGMAHAHMVELANQKLHSRRPLFLENLKVYEEDNVFIIELDAKMAWINDGMGQHDMLDGLLASPKAKRAKDGSKYIIVPFKHGPGEGGAQTTPAQADLVATIKRAFETQKNPIPWNKLEMGSNGKPKLGRLHSLNIMHKPVKTHHGPEQGKGPIGAPRQGITGIPFLQGVSVYQRENKEGKVERGILTFRIASSKHKGERWMHPGVEGTHLFEDTYKWAMDEWNNTIAPQVFQRVMKQISG